MNKEKSSARRYTFKERFNYWFDNRMAKGSLGFIRVLIIASVILAVIIAGLIILFGFQEDAETASVFWDSIATILNAWMPSYEDGSVGYIVLMAVSAIAGVLFTSVLIGIVTSAIEEKIVDLKKGNSIVLEEDHTVILGFNEGEYTLLEQLILAADGAPECVVIADELERDEMEAGIKENLDVPKNFRIICRTADIIDPVSIEKLSIETCRTVIITPTDEIRTIKTLLAVSALLHEKDCGNVRVNAILSGSRFDFPASLAQKRGIRAIRTNETLSKIVAHSCTQRGISETFREIFNFEGDEMFVVELPGLAGLSFRELSARLENAVPLGAFHDGHTILNPAPDFRFAPGDRVFVFAETQGSARLTDAAPVSDGDGGLPPELITEPETETVILGYNESLPVILRELPGNVTRVVLAGNAETPYEHEKIDAAASARGLEVCYSESDIAEADALLALAQRAEHIVILNDHDQDEDEADMDAMLLLLTLRELRAQHGLQFNITTELRREQNQNLVIDEDHTDFVVASSMSSLFLAQLAESPDLVEVFSELLSNEGSELFLKRVGRAGVYSVQRLRSALLEQGYVFLGYVDAEFENCFNPPLHAELTLTENDRLIVLGEE